MSTEKIGPAAGPEVQYLLARTLERYVQTGDD